MNELMAIGGWIIVGGSMVLEFLGIIWSLKVEE